MKRMKYDNDRQRYIMRRARILWRSGWGAWHHEPSSFGVLILDNEGAKDLAALVDRGYLDYRPPTYGRDWGYQLAKEYQS